MRKTLLLTPCILMACVAMASVARAPSSSTAIVAVDPSSITDVYPGDTFPINITINDVYAEEGVHGGVFNWVLAIGWNGSVLRVAHDEWGYPRIVEGPFLKEKAPPGKTSFMYADPTPSGIPDMGCTFLVEIEAEGSGTLVTITFEAIAVGTTDITIDGCLLYDYPANSIPREIEDGTVTVIPEFPSSMILPLFLIVTATIAILAKLVWSRRRRGYIYAP